MRSSPSILLSFIAVLGGCVGDSPTSTIPDAATTTDAAASEAAVDAGPFNANFYGGLELWLSADVSVTVTGGKVNEWADRSLKARQVKAGVAGNCAGAPTLTPSALHGLPMVTFDGAQSCMTVSGAFRDFTAGMTAFIVFQPKSCNSSFLGNSSAIFDSFEDIGSTYAHGISIGRNPTPAQTASGDAILVIDDGSPAQAGIVGSGSWVPATAELLEMRLPPAPGGTLVQATAYVNGTLASLSPNSPTIPDVSPGRSTTYLGTKAYAVTPYGGYCGDLGEILVFSKALTDGDRLAIEAYLKSHWKL
ncbi:hypothetical protein BH09MYX1_BH09MYX1_05870 [soil metagenome]